MKRTALVLLGLAALLPAQVQTEEAFEECTVGVASGRATPDGRPLLWKTRDTSARHNEVELFTDGKHRYLALVTSGANKSAWAGVNDKGFCIMNSVSSDFPSESGKGMGNGGFMKLALKTCANVEEFEALLDRTGKVGRRTKANFGVIDATGAAAVFETGNHNHKRFDATDKKVAPEGFIVRSNFAMTQKDKRPKVRERSLQRYQRGNQICEAAVQKEELTYRHLLRRFCRDLADADGKPYAIPLEAAAHGENVTAPKGSFDNNKCINRASTMSAVVFHGVRGQEDPALTTFWVILGEPIFSVAVPCWVHAGKVAPELDGSKRSPLCNATLELKKASYQVRDARAVRNASVAKGAQAARPVVRERGLSSRPTSRPRSGNRRWSRKTHYLQTAGLPRIWQQTYPTEDRIFAATQARMKVWRKQLPSADDMRAFHRSMATMAHDCVRSLVPEKAAK